MKLYVKKTTNKQGTKETLWIDFTHNGKRYRKSLKLDNTPKNVRLAEKMLIPKLSYEIASGEFFKNTVPTVDEYMKVSFELHRCERSDPVIYDYEKKYIKHIKPIFGHLKIDTITTHSITKWQNKLLLENELKPKSIRQIRGLLYTMFEDALKENKSIISKNPIIGVGKLKEQIFITEDNIDTIIDTPIKPFSLKEIDIILNNSINTQMRNMFALLFFTGCRGGEAISITWNKINFEKKEIIIDRKIRKGLFGLPKNNSVRKVVILDVLIPYLKSQFELTGDKNSFIFLNARGKNFWDISKIRENYWKKTLIMNNIDYRSPHQTRHTFISTLISNGEDINYVSKLAGHDSIKTTIDVYSHFIPNNNKDFGSIFNKKLGTN